LCSRASPRAQKSAPGPHRQFCFGRKTEKLTSPMPPHRRAAEHRVEPRRVATA
jgi:hypothetical protein